jgi:hypothetical protein
VPAACRRQARHTNAKYCKNVNAVALVCPATCLWFPWANAVCGQPPVLRTRRINPADGELPATTPMLRPGVFRIGVEGGRRPSETCRHPAATGNETIGALSRMLAHRVLDGYMTGGSIDATSASPLRKDCKDLSDGALAQV